MADKDRIASGPRTSARTMRAIVHDRYGSADVLRLAEIGIPEIAGHEVLLQVHAAGELDPGQVVVCTVTGHGLKDPQWALQSEDGTPVQPVRVQVDAVSVATALGLD